MMRGVSTSRCSYGHMRERLALRSCMHELASAELAVGTHACVPLFVRDSIDVYVKCHARTPLAPSLSLPGLQRNARYRILGMARSSSGHTRTLV